MGFIKPGKYSGFTVEEYPGDGTRVVVNGKATIFNANGVEIEEEAPPKPTTGDGGADDTKKKAPAGESDWTERVRSR